jgi:phage terminase small subunit
MAGRYSCWHAGNIVGLRGPKSFAEQVITQQGRLARSAARKARSPARKPSSTPQKSHQVIPASQPPPKHLKPETREWWRTIISAFELEQHQYRTLLIAAEALDRRELARSALKKHGMVYTDEKGVVRQRPEVMIERDSGFAFMRALKSLNFESEAL